MDCAEALIFVDWPTTYLTLTSKTLMHCEGRELEAAEQMVLLMFEHPERIQITKLEVSQ